MIRKWLLIVIVSCVVALVTLGDEEESSSQEVDGKGSEESTVAEKRTGNDSERASQASGDKELKPLNLKQKIKVNSNIDLPQDI